MFLYFVDLSVINVGSNFNKDLDHILSDIRENAEHCTIVRGEMGNVEHNSMSSDKEESMRNEEMIINGVNNVAMVTFCVDGMDDDVDGMDDDVDGMDGNVDGMDGDVVAGGDIDRDAVNGAGMDGDALNGGGMEGDAVNGDQEIMVISNVVGTETITVDSQAKKSDGEIQTIGVKVKAQKRKKMADANSTRVVKGSAESVFSSPVAWRLRSSKHSKPVVDDKYVFNKR